MIRLSDEQWERIRDHFPEEHIPDGRPGRKPVPARRVLDAVLWILNTGAEWHMLPQCYPNYKTVHRRFQSWCEREILRILTEIANELRDRGEIDEKRALSTRHLRLPRAAAPKSVRPAWQRREDHGHCRPPWSAAVDKYTCCESSRSHLGATELRLLHARSEARFVPLPNTSDENSLPHLTIRPRLVGVSARHCAATLPIRDVLNYASGKAGDRCAPRPVAAALGLAAPGRAAAPDAVA